MSAKTVLFIDSRVAGYETLIAGLDSETQCHVLDPQQDGIAQIERLLADASDLDAIQIISHGAPGTLYLGSTVLTGSNLPDHAQRLQNIGASLTTTGDLLLYGCNVAQGVEGEAFVNALAVLTGTDVAASTDATGSTVAGANSVLEAQTGAVETSGLNLGWLAGTLAANTAPTFTVGDGKVTTDFGLLDVGYSVTLQSDGKILVAGSSSTSINGEREFALARYNSNGSLDATFDADGLVTTNFGSEIDTFVVQSEALSVLVQPDGKILLGGASNRSFVLARYDRSGSLDTTFDNDGKVATLWSGEGRSAAIQSDGKILLAGSSYTITKSNFALARYTSNGSLDSTFGTDGKVTTDFGGYSQGSSVVVQSDGKILVAGTDETNGNGSFAIARYNNNGSLDTTFDIDGKVTTDFGDFDSGFAITVQADGKILVGGRTFVNGEYAFAMARYGTNGSLDATFGSGGKVISDSDGLRSITVLSDGKILVGGSAYANGIHYFALAKFNLDGSLDTGFGIGGKVSTAFGGYVEGISVAVQPDGKILLAGRTDSDFALARYNSDGSLDTTFSPPENTLQQRGAAAFTEPQYSWSSYAVALAPDAGILDAQLTAAGHYAGATLTLARQGGANAQDVFSNISAGTLTVLNQGDYFAVGGVSIGRVTTNSNGTLVLAFNSNATQSLVNKAMQQIAYANTSDAPPASVQIAWTFNDGNTGAQGTGGAMSVTGTSTVNITATNDAPVAGAPLQGQTVSINAPFSYPLPAGAFTDPDLEALTYTVKMANGTGAPPWISINPATGALSGTPDPLDAGTTFALRITATDAAGASASSDFSMAVTATAPTPVNTAPTGSVTITGTPKQGQTLTATNTLADADGLGTINYQWKANGSAINGATASSYTLTPADVGKTITVTASYTDGQGTAESKTSSATATVTDSSNGPALSKDDDYMVLQYASPAILGAGVGNDTYLISGHMLPAGTKITISDVLGSNSLQLAPKLSLASFKVAASSLLLTLDTGAVITVLGADRFTYDVGGASPVGIDNPDISYADFVRDTLGVTMPSGAGMVSGGALVLGVPMDGG